MTRAAISRPIGKVLRLMLVSLLGFTLIWTPVLIPSVLTLAHQVPDSRLRVSGLTPDDITADDNMEPWLVATGRGVGASLLQKGIVAYEAGQYPQAIDLWNQALQQFQASNEVLNQALVQSNLSLAYQRLGMWIQAERAIVTSLDLLKTQPTGISGVNYHQALAMVWNTQGRQQWVSGQPQAALESWYKASQYYQQANYTPGLVGSQINQARALQSMGLGIAAEKTLGQVKQTLNQAQLPSSVRAIGLRNLGVVLRQIGLLTDSADVLRDSLTLAQTSTADWGATLLELGNTMRALGDRAAAISRLVDARNFREHAIRYYQQTAQLSASPAMTVNAQLNHLSLLVDLQRWFADLQSDIRLNKNPRNPAHDIQAWVRQATEQRRVASLVTDVQTGLDRLPTGRNSLYARLNLAQSQMQLEAAGSRVKGGKMVAIAQQISKAVQQARDLQDRRAESYATGQLGALYEQVGQYQDAQSLTQQALLLTESIQAPEIRYRWEWQLGRLQKAQGNVSRAIEHYQAAVNTLESVRSDLLYINADVQFSFRDSVEPVYRGLVDVLLQPQGNNPPSQANLRRAIQEVDNLQLSELENFMGCDLGSAVAVTDVNADPAAATLYPLLLDDRLAVILKLPGQEQLTIHQTPVSRQTVEDTLNRLYQNLSVPGNSPVPEAIQVYQWLIQPIAEQLAQAKAVNTLVFVADGLLRKIPMAVLYDGDRYLIERYAVALAPRLELFSPRPRLTTPVVFTGGVEQAKIVDPGKFPPIELLHQELDGIAAYTNIRESLRDQNFTLQNLETQLAQGGFSVVHLKTHGQFSSDPAETFIIAYDRLINTRDLGQLIQTSVEGIGDTIDLLVLSACYGAKGDNRAVLGLTGIALQSGARSALATLWEAQDVSNTSLMIRFYQSLLKPNTSKAQALQQAQLSLMQDEGYANPYYWATYVLVGNWL
ncbi:MAG: CHAT domain-containing protein [Cyanobacteria bacterium]|nr:CHAT domain-containing protein [Cyanobacteriota bacterium]MDW8202085.1 CHAT domain-containing protein [Cyanobacteriota bacterium SKYGB_h_bin112]